MEPPSRRWHVLETGHLTTAEARLADFAADVAHGLGEHPRVLPSRYFYDAEGSHLFQQITDLPEYYLTRVEHEILTRHSEALVHMAGDRPLNLVDLGAGDGRKTRVLLDAFVEAGADVRYVPIDISRTAMSELVDALSTRLPHLEIAGVVAEYFDGLRWLSSQTDRRNLVLFLGSNIGNFDLTGARRFLRELRRAANPDDLVLLGFDLKKDPRVLVPAYSDAAGITARFNLNLLTRINRELGADFDVAGFMHWASWDPLRGAMVSHLISRRDQTVWIEALREHFHFEAWESMRTEQSHKYGHEDITRLATACGYSEAQRYVDPDVWFCDALWRVGT